MLTVDELLELLKDRFGGVISPSSYLRFSGTGVTLYPRDKDTPKPREEWKVGVWVPGGRARRAVSLDRMLQGDFPAKEEVLAAAKYYQDHYGEFEDVMDHAKKINFPIFVDRPGYYIFGKRHESGNSQQQINYCMDMHRMSITFTKNQVTPEEMKKVLDALLPIINKK